MDKIDKNPDTLQKAAQAIADADALLIGASNGLSIAEGYHVFADNDMFRSRFGDFRQRYGIRNVIEGCFFPYPDAESRKEFCRRLVQQWVEEYRPSEVMKDLLALVGGKDYFVLTTNGDTHLELAGFHPTQVFELEGTFLQMLHDAPIEDKSGELQQFLAHYHGKRLVILELGIGSRNRLIKLPLMQLTAREPYATYITLNLAHELYIPDEISRQSIGLPGDIAATLHELNQLVPIERTSPEM